QKKRGISEPENVPNDDPFEITLEHVLPENIPDAGDWSVFDQEQRALFTGRLGNMVLLKASVNSDLKSKPFEEKKKVYKDSDFILTSEIDNIADWTPDAVLERQNSLAKLAVEAWPITV